MDSKAEEIVRKYYPGKPLPGPDFGIGDAMAVKGTSLTGDGSAAASLDRSRPPRGDGQTPVVMRLEAAAIAARAAADRTEELAVKLCGPVPPETASDMPPPAEGAIARIERLAAEIAAAATKSTKAVVRIEARAGLEG